MVVFEGSTRGLVKDDTAKLVASVSAVLALVAVFLAIVAILRVGLCVASSLQRLSTIVTTVASTDGKIAERHVTIIVMSSKVAGMNSTVEALLVLQDRDSQVAKLSGELDSMPGLIAGVERDLAARTAKFEEVRTKTRQIEADRKKIDLDVQSKQAAIARYKSQQQQTRKNEEFSALNHEIEHAEKEISGLEDTELELMEAYDKGLASVAEAQKELLAFQEKAKLKKADLEKRTAALSAELITAEEKQGVAEKAVPEDVLPRYRRILKSKKDVAIVPIHGGACSGCHMKLTPNTVISAKGGESLVSCENCGRLVYWAE